MENNVQENKKRYFNIDREGWILFFLLSVIQAFIWYASYVHSENSSALGYVSFAGTLISIILAVLAIGYTYGESVKQKNESQTLASQLVSLVKITKSLKASVGAFDEIKNIKSELENVAEKIEIGFKTTDERVSSIHNSMMEKLLLDGAHKDTKPSTVKNIDKIAVFDALLKGQAPALLISLMLIFISIRRFSDEDSISNKLKSVVTVYSEQLPKFDPEGVSDIFWIGVSSSYYSALRSLGILLKNGAILPEISGDLMRSIKENFLDDPDLGNPDEFPEPILNLVSDFKKEYKLELEMLNMQS